MLYKITEFEQVPNTDWKRNALLLGSILSYDNEDGSPWPGRDSAELMELCKNELLTGFSCTTMYEKEGLAPCQYPCDFPLNRSNVIDQWGSSKGWGIVNKAGHGNSRGIYKTIWLHDDGDGIPEGEWPNYELYSERFLSSFDNIKLNDYKPPIVFSCSCLNAEPEDELNLGASLLEFGASAYIGATRVSYGMFGWKKPWHGGSWSLCYYFNERVAKLGQNCGEAFFNAKVKYEKNFNLIWYWMANLYNFNLYGDPSMIGLNCPPDQPSKPYGPIIGKSFELCKYNSTASDPDDDQIYYLFDWGDYTTSGWIGPYNSGEEAEASHRWIFQGSYTIKVKVKDIFGVESEWSDPLTLTIPKNKPINSKFYLLGWLFDKFPNAFPILQQIFGL
jgi:hypothetical protein